MTLPLTHRIASAAVLLAAGTVPLLATGSASATEPAPAVDTSGLQHVASGDLGKTATSATQAISDLVGDTSGKALGALTSGAGRAGARTAPHRDGLAGAGQLVDTAARQTTHGVDASLEQQRLEQAVKANSAKLGHTVEQFLKDSAAAPHHQAGDTKDTPKTLPVGFVPGSDALPGFGTVR